MHKNSAHTDPHRQYDIPLLVKNCPALAGFIITNRYGTETIDFADPDAVKAFNKALLISYYHITYWDIPDGYLTPPVPGRALYIEKIAELLAASQGGKIPTGKSCRILDIGTGANCIYPIIGHASYGWHFTGTDIDRDALSAAEKIIQKNSALHGAVDLRLQPQCGNIFKGIIQPDDFFEAVICNPPFHASAAEAEKGSLRKWKNLKKNDTNAAPVLNFGGASHELWCRGGEAAFADAMIEESLLFKKSCRWFTILISKESSLPGVKSALKKAHPAEIRFIDMKLGNKISRIAAWRYA